MKRLFLCWAER